MCRIPLPTGRAAVLDDVMRLLRVTTPPSEPLPGSRRVRRWAWGLSLGCLWFAGLAFTRTRRVAEIAKVTPTAVRLLGLRDLLSAATLIAARDPRPAIVFRILCDGSDVVTFSRRRPWLAGVAALYGTLGVIALRHGSQQQRPSDR
jgi:hypothetical protein